MFAIPRAVLDSLNLVPNSQVGLSVSEGRLIIEPSRRPQYSLAELLKQCDLSAAVTEEDRAWFDAAPVGREDI